MKSVFLGLLGIVLIIWSCDNTSTSEQNASESSGISTEQVVDLSGLSKFRHFDAVLHPVPLPSTPRHTVALYYPSYYNPQTKWPVLILFEPSGMGWKVVRKYKDLAEQYGFVLMAPNFPYDRAQVKDRGANFTYINRDLSKFISIDPKQIHTMGFGHAAYTALDYAMVDRRIRTATMSGPGVHLDELEFRPELRINGVVGRQNFNMPEMISINDRLQKEGYRSNLLIFNGRQSLPPVSAVAHLIRFMRLDYYSSSPKSAPKEIVEKLKTEVLEALEQDMRKDPTYALYTKYEMMINCLEKISDVEEMKLQLHTMDGQYESSTKRLKAIIADEVNAGEHLNTAIFTNDLDWWEQEVRRLRSERQGAIELLNDHDLADSYSRRIHFCGYMAYTISKKNYDQNMLMEAENALKVFRFLQPDNPYVYLLESIKYALIKENDRSLQKMAKMDSLGMDDLSVVTSHFAFKEFKQNAEYQTIMDNIRKRQYQEVRD